MTRLEGQLLAHVETHVRQLEADVGVELAFVDFVEHGWLELGAGAGFVGVGDVLAQIVDADAGAHLLIARGANYVRNLGSGDEACGSALAKAGVLGDSRAATGSLTVQ